MLKDGLAMRLTKAGKRWSCATLALAFAAGPGCHRLPYIDQSRPMPREALGDLIEERGGDARKDPSVRPVSFTDERGGGVPGFDDGANLAELPQLSPPRTTDNPEGETYWYLTLEEAIQIYLDNSETIRVIALGAQGIPVTGFEPTPLNTGAGGGSALGAGSLVTVYDPAIQETQIARALSVFDAQFQTNLFWGRNVNPVNNGIQAGQIGGPRFPVIFDQKNSQLAMQLQKRFATGSTLQLQQNINYTYNNNLFNAYPSAYTSNFQFAFIHPLLGGDPQNGLSGLQANRAPIVIARLQADSSVWQFKREVMAGVRGVEQQYWALAQSQMQLWSREQAVNLAEKILEKERAQLAVGKGSIENVAEAEQRLRGFQVQRVELLQQLLTTERQLRNILGLPPSDNRRIVTATAPVEARVDVDWQTCVSQMMSYLPDIVVQQLAVRVAEMNVLIARNQLLPRLDLSLVYGVNGLGRHLDEAFKTQWGGALESINPLISQAQQQAGVNVQPANYRNFENWQVGFTLQFPIGYRRPLAETREAQLALLRQRTYLQQTVHQSIHQVYRFILDVDSNYKTFRFASLARESAATQLKVRRARYELGQILIDNYLDSVARWADAVSEEARYKTQYNISIIALEEAKGTLLSYDNIALSEGPYPDKAYAQVMDQQAGHIRHSTGDDAPNTVPLRTGPAHLDPLPDQFPPTSEPLPPFPVPAPGGPLGPPATPTAPARPSGLPEPLTLDAGPRPSILGTGSGTGTAGGFGSMSGSPGSRRLGTILGSADSRVTPAGAGSAGGPGDGETLPIRIPVRAASDGPNPKREDNPPIELPPLPQPR